MTHYTLQTPVQWGVTHYSRVTRPRDTPGVVIACQECAPGQGLNWKLKQVCTGYAKNKGELLINYRKLELRNYLGRNQEVPWGVTNQFFALFVLSLVFLPGKFEYEGGNKRNFWKFYWFNPPGISRVTNVKTRRPALSNVIKYFCYPLFHSLPVQLAFEGSTFNQLKYTKVLGSSKYNPILPPMRLRWEKLFNIKLRRRTPSG